MAPTSSTSPDDRSLLVVILETSPKAWVAGVGDAPSTVDLVMNQLLLFLNAYLGMRDDNLIAVVACHTKKSRLVFANGPEGTANNYTPMSDAALSDLRGKYEQFATMNRIVWQEIKLLIESQEGLNGVQQALSSAESSLSASLSLSLCYVNRVLKNDRLAGVKPRLLVISMSPDMPQQYIPIMNCIFSAQKLSIPIDVCSLGPSESAFLQQAAHITQGYFTKVTNLASLFQTLLCLFLADRHSRRLMVMPAKQDVDFRASCFCHKNMIDIGYVCSVCLSIFCSRDLDICGTCGTKFSKSLQATSKVPTTPAL